MGHLAEQHRAAASFESPKQVCEAVGARHKCDAEHHWETRGTEGLSDGALSASVGDI